MNKPHDIPSTSPSSTAVDSHSVMFITQRPELVMTEGLGSWLVDHNGKRYLDFLQGWAVNCLGHSNPGMIAAMNAQARKLINPSPAFYNEPMIRLSNLLTEQSCFNRVFFANSGAEANEGAIKLARKWGQLHKSGAHEIITFEHSFHGRTLATMSASGKPGWDMMFAPQVPGFLKAGCGRTGKLFAYQHYNIKPDIMTLGKGIGGGVPLAALLATEEVACFVPGDQGGTYNGNALMTAVGISVIEQLLAPGFLDEVVRKGELLSRELQTLATEFNLEGERGKGLLRALMLGSDIGPKLVEMARDQGPEGLLINSPRPNLLRFMPSLAVSDAEIMQMCGMLRGLLRQTH